MRWSVRLVASLSLFAALAPAAIAADPPSLGALAWLAGRWELREGTRVVEELWTDPAENAMVGLSRTTKGARLTSFEFLRIEARADGIFYVAQPGGVPPTDFRMTSLDAREAIFENPEHDFPKRVLYRRVGSGLEARVDGGAAGGDAEVVRYKRKK